MLLEPLSYLVGLLSLLALLLCLAAGLLNICNWIEEYPTLAHRVSYRLTSTTFALYLLLATLDHLPWKYAGLMLLSNALHLYQLRALHSRSPNANAHGKGERRSGIAASTATIAQFVLPLLGHAILLAYLRPPKEAGPVIRAAHWPGGRRDWDLLDDDDDDDDVQQLRSSGRSQARATYTTGQALTLMAIHWVPTVWALLGFVAQTWALPTFSTISNGSIGDADMRKRYREVSTGRAPLKGNEKGNRCRRADCVDVTKLE